MICDISKHQGAIDWSRLAPELDFVAIKASGKWANQGDPRYVENVAGAVAHGVPFHAYHYLYSLTETEAKRDAGLFYRIVSIAERWPLFWVLDCEAGWGVANARARPIAEAFEAELRRLARANGPGEIRVAMYVAQEKYYAYALDYDLYAYVWIPGYGEKYKPKMPCDIWQYTDKGRLPGISGNVDLDKLVSEKPMSYFTNPTDKKERDTMATVKIGSARIDENGNATGGKAGDQTGKEVSTQNWYKHNKGWRVFRAKNSSVAEKIAWDMQAACDNPKIGYDQSQRDTLYTVAKLVGFNCAKVAAACETDCSALVRVCCAYAGVMLPNIRTTNEPKALLDSGAFVELTGAKYTDQADYLRRGDILCTRTQGHTVVVLSSGGKAEVAPIAQGLSRGDHGSAVTAMQRALLAWKPGCLPKWGADGDFGSETEAALKDFQKSMGLPVTGVYDAITREALTTAQAAPPAEEPAPLPDVEGPEWVLATGNVNVRAAPGTDARVLGVLHKMESAPYQGEKREWGGRDWYLIEYKGVNGWVSSKYARLV